MIYKDFQGKKLSALGMGAMRLPVIDGDDTKVDNDKVKEMVACAMEKGINYYDTAGVSRRQFGAGDGRGAERISERELLSCG